MQQKIIIHTNQMNVDGLKEIMAMSGISEVSPNDTQITALVTAASEAEINKFISEIEKRTDVNSVEIV